MVVHVTYVVVGVSLLYQHADMVVHVTYVVVGVSLLYQHADMVVHVTYVVVGVSLLYQHADMVVHVTYVVVGVSLLYQHADMVVHVTYVVVGVSLLYQHADMVVHVSGGLIQVVHRKLCRKHVLLIVRDLKNITIQVSNKCFNMYNHIIFKNEFYISQNLKVRRSLSRTCNLDII